MPEPQERVSAPEYARLAGLSYSGVRRRAEEGKIAGATKDERGRWLLPTPSSLGDRLAGQNAWIAGIGDSRKASDYRNFEKEIKERHGRVTKATIRAFFRNVPESEIRSAKLVKIALRDKRGKVEYRTMPRPLHRRTPENLIRSWRDRYGIGFPA